MMGNKMKRFETKNNRTGNNKGTTMLETLVAFTVLMVILAVLYAIIAFCSELKMSATDMNNAMQEFSQELYNEGNRGNTSAPVLVTPIETTSSGGTRSSLFYLKISDDMTAEEKTRNGITATDTSKKISLWQINAVMYKYNKPTSDYVIVPKAMDFVHKNDWTVLRWDTP